MLKTPFWFCAGGGVGQASARRSCVYALVILLKSDEPWLLEQEDQLCRGLQELNEASLASETIKRRKTYVTSASRRHPRALIFEISASKLCLTCSIPIPDSAVVFFTIVTGSTLQLTHIPIWARSQRRLHVRM